MDVERFTLFLVTTIAGSLVLVGLAVLVGPLPILALLVLLPVVALTTAYMGQQRRRQIEESA